MKVGSPIVSTIVVLFNSADYIEACLDSVRDSSFGDMQLVLVDNGSKDGSAMLARRIASRDGIDCQISMLQKNSGFARANNRGFELAAGRIILLLNPDAELYEDTVGEIVKAFEDESVGIVGCKVYYPDRQTLQHAGGYVRDNGLTMHYGVGEKDEGRYDEPRDVPYVTGAALAVRRDLFERLGELDPHFYPAYFEELDLCLQARRLGYRVLYVPSARIIHHESTTTGRFTKRYYYLYHRNRIRFLLKNFSWRFLLDRSWAMERRWLELIDPAEQNTPLLRAYQTNLLRLPFTLCARFLMERRLRSPRLEDTVSEL